MELSLDYESLIVYKALASETRLDLLNRIAERPMTVSEAAAATGLSKAIISRHIKLLEDARLIRLTGEDRQEYDHRKKSFCLNVDRVEIDFPRKLFLPYHHKTAEIKLGYYSDFLVTPTCGLAGEDGLIGAVDDPRTFVTNERIQAVLLWFYEGYVEYLIPNELETGHVPRLLELSLELSSEFPGSNNNWPSDITFFINDIEVGTYTSPGNYSDVRGRYTPQWWDSRFSQYGLLKHLRVTAKDSGIDGQKLSDIGLKDLQITASPFIKLRIQIKEDARHKGGLTLFGKSFGNHPQNILLTMYYSAETAE